MKIIESILNILAPYNCLVCHQEGSLLCDTCRVDACQPVPSRCYRCKKLTNDFAVCGSCRRTSGLLNVWVITEYEGVPKKLIHCLKFQSSRAAARIVAKQMTELLPILPRDILITAIPTASSRRRQRGYDHSQRIAKLLSNNLSLTYSTLLNRVGQTRQVGTGRDLRQKQLNNAFFVSKDVSGKTILLVDDVTTTGATLESAAHALKIAGAKKAYAVVFAQKI